MSAWRNLITGHHNLYRSWLGAHGMGKVTVHNLPIESSPPVSRRSQGHFSEPSVEVPKAIVSKSIKSVDANSKS